MVLSQSSLYKKQILILLLIILASGALIRLYGLGKQSLWYDELLNWHRSSEKNISLLYLRVANNEPHPPGYYFLLRYVIKFFGDSETALRIPSAIFGILSVLVIFLLGRQIYSYREGLIAASLMAFLYQPIYYSQEARPYMMLLFFTMLSAYYLIAIIQAFKKKNRPSYYLIAGYIISAVIACYTHYFGLCFVALETVGLLSFVIRRARGVRLTFLIYLAVFFAYLPWLPGFCKQLFSESLVLNNWIRRPAGIYVSLDNFIVFIFHHPIVFGLFCLLTLILVLRSLIKTSKSNLFKKIKSYFNSSAFLLVLWAIIPFIGAYIISIFWKPILSNRNLIISLPAVYLLISRVINQIPLRIKYKVVAIILLIFFSLYNLIIIRGHYSRFHKERFREAIKYIADNYNDYKDSYIITWGAPRRCFTYYFSRYGLPKERMIEGPWRPTVNPLNSLVFLSEDLKYIWYLRVHMEEPEHDAEFLNFLQRSFKTVSCEVFSDSEKVCLLKQEDIVNRGAVFADYIKRYLNKKHNTLKSSRNIEKSKYFFRQIFGPPISLDNAEEFKKDVFIKDSYEEIHSAEIVFRRDFKNTVILVLFIPSQDSDQTIIKMLTFKK